MAGIRRLFSAQTLIGNIKRYYKATVENRWTQVESESPVMEVQSFVIPGMHTVEARRPPSWAIR